jgi:ParB-like chromosome segregation protein Spo0J
LQNININLIENNTGQLDNVPQNPRDLTNNGFELAKKSIAEFPEMLQVRTLVVVPKNNKYVTIGGNQRLKAMRDLGYTEAPCVVVDWNSDQI